MRGRVWVAVVLGVFLAGCSSSTNTAPSTVTTFDARPVLCYAPNASPSSTPSAPRGVALPACAPQYVLTASKLHVRPSSSAYAGYTINVHIPPDPQFTAYPSTPTTAEAPSQEVLLPSALKGTTRLRYVLGPTSLSRASVLSALAYDEAGIWVDNVVLTDAGISAWNAMAKSQFHAFVAFVVNGKVLVASLIEPTQSSFSPSDGAIQVNAGLSEGQAKTLAAELS
jgi:hypothetical protein